mgnify:CR=1 FL=1
MPSDNVTICRFCRSGDLSHLHRRFVGLSDKAKRLVLDMMHEGLEPKLAITRARKQEKMK